jgi:hypothetical protein
MVLFHIMIQLKALNNSIYKNHIFSKYFVIYSQPWFTDRQHSGFVQIYNGIVFFTVKGASHTVPQTKRA